YKTTLEKQPMATRTSANPNRRSFAFLDGAGMESGLFIFGRRAASLHRFFDRVWTGYLICIAAVERGLYPLLFLSIKTETKCSKCSERASCHVSGRLLLLGKQAGVYIQNGWYV